MAIKFINGSDVEKSLPKGSAIVNVFATWCGPCKMFAPILEELSEEFPVFKIDIDKNNDFAKEMGVQGVPTTFIYKDGKVVDTLSGFVGMEAVKEKLASIA